MIAEPLEKGISEDIEKGAVSTEWPAARVCAILHLLPIHLLIHDSCPFVSIVSILLSHNSYLSFLYAGIRILPQELRMGCAGCARGLGVWAGTQRTKHARCVSMLRACRHIYSQVK